MQKRDVYCGGIALLCGVACVSIFNLSVSIFAVLCGLCVCVVTCMYVWRTKWWRITVLVIILFLCGVGRMLWVTTHESSSDFLKARVLRDVELFGLVVDEPDVRERNTRLTILPVHVDGERVSPASNEKILVVTDLQYEFAYGDVFSFLGVLSLPENFTTESGREFDYISYLKKEGVVYTMHNPHIHHVFSGRGSALRRLLFSAKRAFVDSVSRVVPEPQSSLGVGMLVGAKHSLGKDLEEKFRQTGLVHVVVLSGYNITIVADVIMKVLSFLPRYAGVFSGVVGIILFAVLTGGSATVVRASLMAILVIAARFSGRTYDVLRALLVASVCMVIHNPRILLSDPSFQLSCMATYALIVLSPKIEERLSWLPEFLNIRSTLASTLATQLFLLPMLVYMSGMISFVSVFTNILVLSVVPLSMALTCVTGVLGFILPFSAQIVGYTSHVILSYILYVVDFFSKLPYAFLMVPSIPIWCVLILYAGFFYWLYGKSGYI